MKRRPFRFKAVATAWVWILAFNLSAGLFVGAENVHQSCTVIGVGKLALADGSVITSHSDCCSECRIQVVPRRTYPKGSLAPVHWGMIYFGAEDNRKSLPLGDFGKVIGHIHQVEKTFAYFHTGYSQLTNANWRSARAPTSDHD
jgi:dipeptidase